MYYVAKGSSKRWTSSFLHKTEQMSYTISNRDEDNYIPHDHGIPVEESRDTTDLVTFPRGSYGARRVVLLGEDRKENTEMGLVVMETDLERLHLP